jgi:hypothetical protein
VSSNLSSAALDALLDALAEKIAERISASPPPPAESEWLTPAQAAALLGLSVTTLEIWRVKGKGPEFCKLGRNVVRYKRMDITAYLERDRRSSTSAPVKRGRK